MICQTLRECLQGIYETLEEGLQGFMTLWKRIHEDSQDLGRGFVRDLPGFTKLLERICKDSQDLER